MIAFYKGVVMMNLKEGGNKNALNRAIGEDGMRDWSFGIFDCLPRCRLCTKTNSIDPSHRVANPVFRFIGYVLSLRRLWAKQAAFTPFEGPRRSSPWWR